MLKFGVFNEAFIKTLILYYRHFWI